MKIRKNIQASILYKRNLISFISMLVIIFCYAIVGGYKLQEIPADWFGDISIINNYVLSILHGNFPYNFTTSNGPLYFYLIAPFVYILHPSYLTYKILSWVTGGFGLLCIYLFIRKITSERVALLTTFLTATSFWYIVWSRLGTINMLFPLIVSLMMYFFFCFLNEKTYKSLFGGIITASLGLFIYPSTFLLPVIFLILIGIACIQKIKGKDKLYIFF